MYTYTYIYMYIEVCTYCIYSITQSRNNQHFNPFSNIFFDFSLFFTEIVKESMIQPNGTLRVDIY